MGSGQPRTTWEPGRPVARHGVRNRRDRRPGRAAEVQREKAREWLSQETGGSAALPPRAV